MIYCYSNYNNRKDLKFYTSAHELCCTIDFCSKEPVSSFLLLKK